MINSLIGNQCQLVVSKGPAWSSVDCLIALHDSLVWFSHIVTGRQTIVHTSYCSWVVIMLDTGGRESVKQVQILEFPSSGPVVQRAPVVYPHRFTAINSEKKSLHCRVSWSYWMRGAGKITFLHRHTTVSVDCMTDSRLPDSINDNWHCDLQGKNWSVQQL